MATRRVPTLDGSDKLPKVFLPTLTAAEVGADPAGAAAAAQAAAMSAAATDATTKAGNAQAAAIAAAVQRAMHTGVQAQSTITGLVPALALKADLVNGKLPTSQLPSEAINETYTVASQAEMLALTAGLNDLAYRTDFDPLKAFLLTALPASTLANWRERPLGSGVQSVNGQTTSVVVLAAADVGAVPTARTISTAAPLTGGGALSGNLTLSITFGATTGTVAAGNDSRFTTGLARANHTGTQPVDTVTETTGLKILTAAERTKLAGIATGATVNATDTFLLGRANHTGTQSYTTITGLGGAARLEVGTTAGTVAAGNDPRFAAGSGGGAPTSRIIATTAPLTGGGDLSADRTLGITVGTTAGSVAAGNDSRFASALQRVNHTGSQAQSTITNLESRLAGIEADVAAGGGSGSGTPTTTVFVTADGATDQGPTIQAVLDNLGTSASKSYKLLIQPLTKGNRIYINSKVRITTSYTEVEFGGPVLLGPAAATGDGFGGFSILGTTPGTTTVSSGAVAGSSKLVVASATGITTNTMIQVKDTDGTGGTVPGDKCELAVVVEVSGSTLYLDRPLSRSYIGTVTLTRTAAVTGSGFVGIDALFVGQQTANFYFPVKFQWARNCYIRNCHFRGDPSNSWSRECINFRFAYRCIASDCTISFGWYYAIGTTYDYGFSADGSTECAWRNCHVSNTRHAFSADRGSSGHIYYGCTSDNGTAGAFDLHGGFCTDITYAFCTATASDTRNSDGQKQGFIAGNTSYVSGVSHITYIGCEVRAYGSYTPNGSGSADGDGIGFCIVDGASNIRIIDCKVYDSMYGIYIESAATPGHTPGGAPISDVVVQGCEFNNINVGSAPLPWIIKLISGGAHAVSDVHFRDNTIVNNTLTASARLYGATGNPITGLVVENNTWRGPGVAGVFPLDVRDCTAPLIDANKFVATRRGVTIQNSPNALITGNTFFRLVDGATASNIVYDAGGNTNLVVGRNKIAGTAITAVGNAPSSSGAQVELMPMPGAYTTTGRPLAAAVGPNAQYFDLTLGKPAWSNGSSWRDAAGTTV